MLGRGIASVLCGGIGVDHLRLILVQEGSCVRDLLLFPILAGLARRR